MGKMRGACNLNSRDLIDGVSLRQHGLAHVVQQGRHSLAEERWDQQEEAVSWLGVDMQGISLSRESRSLGCGSSSYLRADLHTDEHDWIQLDRSDLPDDAISSIWPLLSREADWVLVEPASKASNVWAGRASTLAAVSDTAGKMQCSTPAAAPIPIDLFID